MKKKVLEVLEGLHERARWGYYLESLTQKKASNSCIKISKHGFCFTDKVMNLAEMYLKESDAEEISNGTRRKTNTTNPDMGQ